MPDTPDENAAAPRRTAMQVAEHATTLAQNAMALAHAVDNDLGDNIRPPMTQLRQDLTDLREELSGYQTGTTRQLEKLAERVNAAESGVGIVDAEDQVHSMVEANLAAVLARLEAAERKLAGLEARPTTYTAPEDPRIPTLFDALASMAARLDEAEERLGNPPQFTLDSEQMGRIIERVRGLVAAQSGPTSDLAPVGMVHARVLALMRMVTSIGKERQADLREGGRFKFRGVDDAMDAVGHAMREVGLTLETKMVSQEYTQNPVTNPTRDGGSRTVVWTSAHLVVRYIFVCPEDGSRHTFEMAGEGRDASDKATSKAGSMALKYGLFQALMIPVTGLDDADNESPQVTHENRPARPDQQVSERPAGTDQASRQQRARDALSALRTLDRLPLAQAHQKLGAIGQQVEKEGLGTAEVEGATLRAHIAAIAKTLPQQQPPEVPAQEPPADETLPWT